jgi:hypothetical protein
MIFYTIHTIKIYWYNKTSYGLSIMKLHTRKQYVYEKPTSSFYLREKLKEKLKKHSQITICYQGPPRQSFSAAFFALYLFHARAFGRNCCCRINWKIWTVYFKTLLSGKEGSSSKSTEILPCSSNHLETLVGTW